MQKHALGYQLQSKLDNIVVGGVQADFVESLVELRHWVLIWVVVNDEGEGGKHNDEKSQGLKLGGLRDANNELPKAVLVIEKVKWSGVVDANFNTHFILATTYNFIPVSYTNEKDTLFELWVQIN